MISYPNAKINIGLYITERRPDGFHNIETVFFPIPSLCDILEILPLKNQVGKIKFTQSGLKVEGDPESNLCLKAFRIISKHINLPPISMHLHKQIPMGAGLGGGSADGAFALNMLNQLTKEPLPVNILSEIALELGSDCPFFLTNETCFGMGRGEKLEQLDLNLHGYNIVIVNPGVHINTALAYKKSNPATAPFNLRKLENIAIAKWNELVSNDFEKVVFLDYPEVLRIKNELYSMGAVYSSMSGSGSTVFGIFKIRPSIVGQFDNMFTHTSEL
jgi:4-diphosphocytidyl-2-C-methyl-D-erythritol kinase